MSASTEQAENEMFAVAKDGLVANAPTAIRYWPDSEKNGPPSQDVEWVRVSIRYRDQYQASLSNQNGRRRWRRDGVLNLQIFIPQAAGGRARARLVACAMRDLFQATQTPGGVWFRNVKADDIGPDKSWHNWNVTIPFTYDEVK